MYQVYLSILPVLDIWPGMNVSVKVPEKSLPYRPQGTEQPMPVLTPQFSNFWAPELYENKYLLI